MDGSPHPGSGARLSRGFRQNYDYQASQMEEQVIQLANRQ
jgi:hypothetical protein